MRNARREKVEDLCVLLRTAEESVGLVIDRLDTTGENPSDRRGGYLTILSEFAGRGTLVLLSQIGLVPMDEVHKCIVRSQEKPWRLLNFPDHVSSYQSRDPNAVLHNQSAAEIKPYGKWGGAIRAGAMILSFSGLPELGDEAAMLLTALKLGQINFVKADAIAVISHNKIFYEIVSDLKVRDKWNNGKWFVG